MIISRQQQHGVQLRVDNRIIEQMDRLKYVGITLNNKWDCDKEIRIRAALARNAFIIFNKYLMRQEVPMHLKLGVIECYIWPILLYGADIWPLKLIQY